MFKRSMCVKRSETGCISLNWLFVVFLIFPVAHYVERIVKRTGLFDQLDQDIYTYINWKPCRIVLMWVLTGRTMPRNEGNIKVGHSWAEFCGFFPLARRERNNWLSLNTNPDSSVSVHSSLKYFYFCFFPLLICLFGSASPCLCMFAQRHLEERKSLKAFT